ncbi:MAG: T9SS C-terminal target domain-containing protein [Cytophagales bacterium]|nr:MAG: T9SS C-terminal target domain-containing protein [Cytophagales bacterium]
MFTYNTASANSGYPLSQWASLSIQQYNEAITNSNAFGNPTNYAEYVGLAFSEFDETIAANNQASFAAFDHMRAQNVLSLRDAYNADIVIQFRLNAYDYGGLANDIAVSDPNKSLAIVVLSHAITYRVTAHEIAHLIGAGHDYIDYPTQVSYAKAYSWEQQTSPGVYVRRSTIMSNAYIQERIAYFSSSSATAKFEGYPVGDATHDNARRINEWSPTVGAFKHSPGPNVSMLGPAVVFAAGNYTYEAVYQCRQFQSACWQTSTDGFNYTNAGTGEFNSIYIGQETYVRVTVTYVWGGTATTTRIISAFCPGCRTGTKVVDTDTESPIYPNPANEETTLKFTLTEKAEVSRMIVDMAGKPVERLNFGSMEAGTHEQKINVRSLPPAVYMINLRLGSKTVRQKLLIVR